MYGLDIGKCFGIVRVLVDFRHSGLDLGRLISVDVFEDVLESLRTWVEVLEHLVWLLGFAAVLSDAIDAV